MARKLSPWCKRVQCELINRDMSKAELADAMGRSRTHVSAVINGRLYSMEAVKAISDFLGIPDTDADLPYYHT